MADDDKASRPQQDDDAWIERVVELAGHLGFNKMRLRWKLIRWQEARRRKARQREQLVAHVTYAHKTCHECGAVQDRNEAVCTGCGAKLSSRTVQVLARIGLAMPVPFSMSTLLAVAILVAYGRVWIAGGGGLSGPSGDALVGFGGSSLPLIADEPWRLVTSAFLHAGLWHLGFNLLAIATIGPRIEEIYGRTTMLGLFILTGAIADLGSLWVGPLAAGASAVGIGASGGVMGLIGAAAGYGHRAGTSLGRAVRDAMLQWCAYVFLFGFFVGADNWAHLFGLIGGVAFGFAVKPHTWMLRLLHPLRIVVGLVGLVGTLGAIAIILTRTPELPESPGPITLPIGPRAVSNAYADVCIKLYAGDTEGAIAEARRIAAVVDGVVPAVDEQVAIEMCEWMQQLRDRCTDGSEDSDPEFRPMCAEQQPSFDRLPPRPPQPRPASDAAGSAR